METPDTDLIKTKKKFGRKAVAKSFLGDCHFLPTCALGTPENQTTQDPLLTKKGRKVPLKPWNRVFTLPENISRRKEN